MSQHPLISDTDDYLIYIRSNSPLKGNLLDGQSGKLDEEFKCYSKFGNNRLPIPRDESLRWIAIGLEFTAILTSKNRVYLFGDYFLDGHSKFNDLRGYLIPVVSKSTEGVVVDDHFKTQVLGMQCGEQFICVRDRTDEIWYSGAEQFGSTDAYNYDEKLYQFHNLGLQEFLRGQGLRDTKITHFKTGGRHIILCLNGKIIVGCGANYSGQVGLPSIQQRSLFEFNICRWNASKEYTVLDLACNGSHSTILTSKLSFESCTK